LVNADHVLAQRPEACGLCGERDALVVVDRYSGYMDAYPLMTKQADEVHASLIDYFGCDRPIDVYIWSDSAPETIKAVAKMGMCHGKALPGRHQNNAWCERQIRNIVQGARTTLEHVGLPQCYWVFAIKHWCFMHNVMMVDGDSAWNRRHGTGHFEGPKLPFGCTVDYLPKAETVKAMPKFDTRGIPGILVGDYLQPGGIWKGEYQVFPKEMFEHFDWESPRNLKERVPLRTQEVSMTDPTPQFMMKAGYDTVVNPPELAPGGEGELTTADDDEEDTMRKHPLFSQLQSVR